MPVRDRLVELMHATLADEQQHGTWTYRAVRPLPLPHTWTPGQYVVSDCSWGVRLLCEWAGAPDPMGTGFSGGGNSSTIWSHGQRMDYASECLPGDLVTFGTNGDEHAAMVMEAGADPLLWSDGHQGAPNSYRLSWDKREHQFTRLPVIYVPTPVERLRGMTGFFAWVAWKLGEGDWRHHVPADPSVRPNVPRRIPVSWWRRYAAFLRNRKGAS